MISCERSRVGRCAKAQMKLGHWILDDDGRIKEVDMMTWALWLQNNTAKRIVKQEWIGDTWVSTVFLGLDHNFDPEPHAPIVLWETMSFSNRTQLNQTMDRCSGNREQAEAMHERMVLKVCEIEGINLETARAGKHQTES